MGGREAIRGFAVQTLICLLDALAVDADWIAVTIEPVSANDKVDLLWEYKDRKKAVQVKSSKNPIGRADLKSWCKELKAAREADSYEIRLAGPVSAGVLDGNEFDGVTVPTPTSIVLFDLMEQAITKLDRYLIDSGIESVPLAVRTSLVDICAAKLIIGSSTGTRVERAAFNGWLLHWIATAYPEALAARLSANCEVLWGSLDIMSPPDGNKSFELALPLSVYNVGGGAAVVEWFIIHVRSGMRRMLYHPSGFRQDGRVRPFSEFAVGPGQVCEREVVLSPLNKAGFEVDAWPIGDHELELFVKFSADETPKVVKKATVSITGDHMSLLSHKNTITARISTLDTYLDTL
ncbi:hypothetical protein [Azospirillum palustre]